MNKKILTVIIALLMVSAVIATAVLFIFPYDPYNPPHLDDTGSTSQGIQEVVNANNQFAFDLYSKFIESEEGNVFYSPYSIFSALAILFTNGE